MKTLKPSHILLHPFWLLALLLLVANDHMFKDAITASPLLTGKLSDFSGLLIAPALLAVLFHVRSRRGWTLAHVAVGLVFAAIQLSPWCAQAVASLVTATTGISWTLWSDPWDLAALVVLPFSWRVFLPAMQTQETLTRRASRAAKGVALVAGCAASMATSYRPPMHPAAEAKDSFRADASVHNASDQEIWLTFDELAADHPVNCHEIMSTRNVPNDAWHGDQTTYYLPPHGSAPLRRQFNVQRRCHAARISTPSNVVVTVFWWDGQPPSRDILTTNDPGTSGVLIFTNEITYRVEGPLEELNSPDS